MNAISMTMTVIEKTLMKEAIFSCVYNDFFDLVPEIIITALEMLTMKNSQFIKFVYMLI